MHDDDEFRKKKTLLPPFSEHPTMSVGDGDIQGIFRGIPRILNVGCEGYGVYIDASKLHPYFATHLDVSEALESLHTRSEFEQGVASLQVACFDALSKLEDAVANRLEEMEARYARVESVHSELMKSHALVQERLEAQLASVESTNTSLMSRCALLQCQLDALRGELIRA